MDLRAYLRAVRKHWWMVLTAVLIGVGAAAALVARTPPTYASTVTFFVNTSAATAGSALQNGQYAQDRVTTYVYLLSSKRLANMILEDTQLDMTARELMDEISGSSKLNTVLLTATVEDQSQQRSLRIAKSLSTQFIKMIKSTDSLVELQVTSEPTLYPGPVSPRTNLDLALGFVLGLAIGIGAAVLRDMLDVSVRSVESLRDLTGTPVLGQIGYDSAVKKAPLIVDNHAKSVRAEAFRQLRTNLQFIDVDRPAHVMVVTSSIAAEGKSTTATNLAIIFSEAGRSVLLIEADLRRPRVSDYLGLDRSVGLTNVLAGQVSVDDVLQEWGRGGLTVLSSGSLPPNPSELLGSQNMASLLAELRERFEIIIVDTPPLLPVTDAAVAAVNVDGVVLVVRHGKTKRQQVSGALASLRAVDARILGCVLNMAPMKGTQAYLAYDGYGYYEELHTGELTAVGPERSARQEATRGDQDLDGAAAPQSSRQSKGDVLDEAGSVVADRAGPSNGESSVESTSDNRHERVGPKPGSAVE